MAGTGYKWDASGTAIADQGVEHLGHGLLSTEEAQYDYARVSQRPHQFFLGFGGFQSYGIERYYLGIVIRHPAQGPFGSEDVGVRRGDEQDRLSLGCRVSLFSHCASPL